MNIIPKFVANAVTNHHAWVVGSAADPDNDNPRDWDVIIPFADWHNIAPFIPSHATMNSFGGLKFIENEIEIDVWPGDLAFICRQDKFTWAWNPSLGVRVKKC